PDPLADPLAPVDARLVDAHEIGPDEAPGLGLGELKRRFGAVRIETDGVLEPGRPGAGCGEPDDGAVAQAIGGEQLLLHAAASSRASARTTWAAARAAVAPMNSRAGSSPAWASTSTASSDSAPLTTRSSGRVPSTTTQTGVAGSRPASTRASAIRPAWPAPM